LQSFSKTKYPVTLRLRDLIFLPQPLDFGWSRLSPPDRKIDPPGFALVSPIDRGPLKIAA
jgi:hypothetical protein